MKELTPLTGLLISLPVSLAIAAVAAARNWPPAAIGSAIALLALSGLLAPGIGRLLTIWGIHRLGPAVHVPLQGSAHPGLAVLGGLVLFDEALSLVRAMGLVGIVFGIWMLSRHPPTAALTVAESLSAPRKLTTPWMMLLPICAGFAYGGADVLRKQALVGFAYSEFAAMVAIGSAFIAWLALIATSTTLRGQIRPGRGKRWFVLHGALTSLAVISTFEALRHGDVSVVSPIIAGQPLLVLLLSKGLLQDAEVIGPSTVAGTLSVVTGTVLIVVS